MADIDLNLLIPLEALLTEGSVAGAARRLGLSSSAMSRALGRLRETTGDPLLVRAGRTLVPTPHALKLRERVQRVAGEAHELLRPQQAINLGTVVRSFVLCTSDGFVENFGAALLSRVGREAPGVQLRFVSKFNRDNTALREGSVDLETGVIRNDTGPEVIQRSLFHDRFVGVVRAGHPLLGSPVTAASYAAAGHVLVSRRGGSSGVMDERLAELGLSRHIVATVSGFAAALSLARGSDLLATVPERHTDQLRAGMHTFELPFSNEVLVVSMLWHPRMHADPVHRWLRACVHEVCTSSAPLPSGMVAA